MTKVRDGSKKSSLTTNEREDSLSRRKFLRGSSAALLTAAVAARAEGRQNAQQGAQSQREKSMSDPGPENPPVKAANANSFAPPVTDHGEVQTFWASFSAPHRRIQDGGWSRQVTIEDFPISKEIAGVNMRLTAGGVRELHWHAAAEWAIMLTGSARITAIDDDGKSFVKDVVKDDLWYFPPGTPHSIQGLAPDGAEFVLVFDDGHFSEGNTTLITDWTRHTPPEVLAKNWGVPESALAGVYQVPDAGKYIFQAEVPPPLAADVRDASGSIGPTPIRFDFSLSKMMPTRKSRFGEVRIVDTRNFPISKTMAAAHVVVKPGGLRELHWHQNADEWQYFIQGKGRMTVFFTGSKARTADFAAGDVGYVPRTMGHYVENVGDTDLIFLEMFKTDRFMDLSLSEWVSNTPPELVMQHLGISEETLRAIPKTKPLIAPV